VAILRERQVWRRPPRLATAAKVAAFRTPELYVKLLERFAGAAVPTKDGLRNLLYRDYGIVESMALGAADAFIESLSTAGLVTAGNLVMSSGNGTAAKEKGGAKTDEEVPPPGMKTIQVPQGFVIYKCKISGGRVIDLPLPPDFKMADVNRLHAFLKTQVDDAPEAADGSA